MIRMVRVHQCILLGWLLGSDRTYPTKIRLNCVEKHPLYNAIQELWMATMDYNMGFSENLQNPIIYHHFSYENGWPIWGT